MCMVGTTYLHSTTRYGVVVCHTHCSHAVWQIGMSRMTDATGCCGSLIEEEATALALARAGGGMELEERDWRGHSDDPA